MSPLPTTPARGTAPGHVGRGLGPSAAAVTAAAVGAALVWSSPRGLLLVVLIPLQVLLAASWLTLAAVPARAAGTALAVAAAVAADVVLVAERRPTLGALAGVVGLGVVAAVLGQLLRRERSRVTDVLAAQCSAILLVVAAAPTLALAAAPRGDRVAAVGLIAVALTLPAGELGARARADHARVGRAVVGLLLGGLVAAGVGAAVVGDTGAAAGAAAAVAVVVAELTVAVVAGGRRVGRPLGVLLPFALAAPCVYVVGRVMLG